MATSKRMLGVRRWDELGASEISQLSSTALDVHLEASELRLACVRDDAVILGAYQRASEVSTGGTFFRRASGGAAVRVGAGTLYAGLALVDASSLTPCDPARLVNRYVRPLLKALTRVGAQASYFGRDWVSVAHRPAAYVGFAHDTATGRALVEVFVAVRTPFALGPRASFLGKVPGTLDELTGREIEPARLLDAIEAAYAEAYGLTPARIPTPPPPGRAPRVAEDAPWDATTDEAIGIVAAGIESDGDRAPRLRVGGELMVSRDAIARLEERLAVLPAGASREELEVIVDEELTRPGVAIDGVRSLASLADVLERARQKRA